MSEYTDNAAVCFDKVAATAKTISTKIKHNETWPGDIDKALQEIDVALADARRYAVAGRLERK